MLTAAARPGGEEFIVILPNTDAEEAKIAGERLGLSVAALKIPHATSHTAAIVSISVGCATDAPLLNQFAQGVLVDAVDRRLYQAKEQGRNRICKTELLRCILVSRLFAFKSFGTNLQGFTPDLSTDRAQVFVRSHYFFRSHRVSAAQTSIVLNLYSHGNPLLAIAGKSSGSLSEWLLAPLSNCFNQEKPEKSKHIN